MTGYDRNKERLLKQIQALAFAQNEWVLFLDTHPHERRALREYHRVTAQLKELEEYYNANFGPLTPADIRSETDWTWAHSPWPWEM
ncbi:MAG: spore coat protein CotJB [Ruminococcaceae bacterium]|nr:spore coat protein CotJB [Oscillospiraceae bacterium]